MIFGFSHNNDTIFTLMNWRGKAWSETFIWQFFLSDNSVTQVRRVTAGRESPFSGDCGVRKAVWDVEPDDVIGSRGRRQTNVCCPQIGAWRQQMSAARGRHFRRKLNSKFVVATASFSSQMSTSSNQEVVNKEIKKQQEVVSAFQLRMYATGSEPILFLTEFRPSEFRNSIWKSIV